MYLLEIKLEGHLNTCYLCNWNAILWPSYGQFEVKGILNLKMQTNIALLINPGQAAQTCRLALLYIRDFRFHKAV
jgi:hypothetical protein